METLETSAIYALGFVLVAYLIGAEFLDTIGRLEIIEKRYPRVWRFMSNRPFRLLLLVFLVALIGRDVSERLKETDPPPIKFDIASPKTPVVVYAAPTAKPVIPRVSFRQDGKFLYVTPETAIYHPNLSIKCDGPCVCKSALSLNSAFAGAVTKTLQGQTGFEYRIDVPATLQNQQQIYFVLDSPKGDTAIRVLSVNLIKGN